MPNGGATANWTGLTWSCKIQETSNLHFVVGSGDKVVGSAKITAENFMDCKADQAGVRRVSN